MIARLRRIRAMMVKELHQLRRDRLTFAMMLVMPLMQLVLFGFAINNDPRHLRLALQVSDHSAFTRSIEAALHNSSYFDSWQLVTDSRSGEALVRSGEVQFLLIIPEDFSRQLVRGDRPQLLVIADATDPAATGGAVASIEAAVRSGLRHDLTGPLASLAPEPQPVDVVVQRRYNPEAITSHNIVPGLLGIVLSMTMVMMTAMAVSRERERGTMETMLSMPLRPEEVMIGKVLPYVFIGAAQTLIIVAAAIFAFKVPFVGGFMLFSLATLLFIFASLLLGFTFSTLAKTQLQAMQMSFFYMLPSILLSGFMFPFRGMPGWAQVIGEAIPVTHYLRLVRGVMLKGWDVADAGNELLVLLLMLLAIGAVALSRYGETLD